MSVAIDVSSVIVSTDLHDCNVSYEAVLLILQGFNIVCIRRSIFDK
jgi:hypothetical protein